MEQVNSEIASSSASKFSQSSDMQECLGDVNETDQDKQMGQVHEKSTPFAVGPEMLAEVLNKKRMELLHSPEVRDFLRQQQSKLSNKTHCHDHNLKCKKDSSDSDTSDSQKSDPSNLSSPNR